MSTKDKKVAIYVCGGLGNQLFQFACLLSYCKKYDYQPIFDRKYHGELHTKDLFWEQFGWNEIIPEDSLDKNFHTYQENDAVYQEIPSFSSLSSNSILLRGYYNDERYFKESKEEILDIFRKAIYSVHPNNEPNEKIGVHVRRGDYLKFQHVFHILEKDYYQKALSFLSPSSSLLDGDEGEKKGEKEVVVVSEDLDWCKENIKASEYRNGLILEDFHFLMHCNGLVIANSTFSWWATYLNPLRPSVVFPLEWFKDQRLSGVFKYNVKEWWMASSYPPHIIYEILCQYIVHKKWHSFLSTYLYLIPTCKNKQIELMDIYDAKNGKKNAEKNLQEIIENNIPIEGYYRQNLYNLLGKKMELTIKMREIPCYIIAGEGRREIMRARFEAKCLTPTFIDAVSSISGEKAEGCGKAHINALTEAIKQDKFPCAIFEDDILFTNGYLDEFVLSKDADAFFLGMSRYGMGGWNQMGIRKFINIQEDVKLGGHQLYQIKNMLSAHGILYVNKSYAEKTLALVKACLTMKFINDVGSARAQEEGNVFCMKEPFVVQDITMAKNRHQKQNNMETYVDVSEFQVKPMRRGLLL